MTVWAEWLRNREELGWPRESSELRAFYRAQTATVTDGIAKYCGRVELGGRTVSKLPPPMPKETRPSSGSRVPRIDPARLGPHVDRLLCHMDDTGYYRAGSVIRASFLYPQEEAAHLCMNLGVVTKNGDPALRTWFRCKRRGLARLEELLSWEPRR